MLEALYLCSESINLTYTESIFKQVLRSSSILDLLYGCHNAKPAPATLTRRNSLTAKSQEPKKHPNINFRVGYPYLIGLIKEGILGYPNLMVLV